MLQIILILVVAAVALWAFSFNMKSQYNFLRRLSAWGKGEKWGDGQSWQDDDYQKDEEYKKHLK